jgi:hypothetical protein
VGIAEAWEQEADQGRPAKALLRDVVPMLAVAPVVHSAAGDPFLFDTRQMKWIVKTHYSLNSNQLPVGRYEVKSIASYYLSLCPIKIRPKIALLHAETSDSDRPSPGRADR